MPKDLTREFVVTGTYVDKQTGEPVSSIAPISSGISKSGHSYEIADVSSRETIEGQYRVGTRLTGSMTLTVAQVGEDSAQNHHVVKLGKQ